MTKTEALDTWELCKRKSTVADYFVDVIDLAERDYNAHDDVEEEALECVIGELKVFLRKTSKKNKYESESIAEEYGISEKKKS